MNNGCFTTRSPEETRALANRLAQTLGPGAVLALCGDLGSGKTCFVQGLATGLEVDEPVSSPTFTLVNEYSGRLPLYHVDLYRVRRAREALDLGLDEYLFGGGVTAIEWADRIRDLWPAGTIRVGFARGVSDSERQLTLETAGEPYPLP